MMTFPGKKTKSTPTQHIKHKLQTPLTRGLGGHRKCMAAAVGMQAHDRQQRTIHEKEALGISERAIAFALRFG